MVCDLWERQTDLQAAGQTNYVAWVVVTLEQGFEARVRSPLRRHGDVCVRPGAMNRSVVEHN